MDKWNVCLLCNAVFTFNVPSGAEQAEIGSQEDYLAGPVTSAACRHVLCYQCVKQQTLMIPPDNQDVENQLEDYVRCPVCFMPDAFNVENTIISAVVCGLLKVVHEQTLFIDQAWDQEEDCKMPSSQYKEVADLEDDPNSPTPDLNLMGKEKIKAAHFAETPDTYVFVEEEDLQYKHGVARGKKQSLKVEPVGHPTVICSDEEEETFLSNERPFVRVPRDDESSDDDSDGTQKGAKKQVSDVKDRHDSYISGDQGPELSLQLQYATIPDDDELFDKVPEVSPAVNSSNQNQVVERPSRPPSLPGAFHIVGPHLDTIGQNNSPRGITQSQGEEIVATLVEPAPYIPYAIAEPFVSFYVKYKWFILGLSFAVLAATVFTLAVVIQRRTRVKRLKGIAYDVSNQTSTKVIGTSQQDAMNWLIGTNNTRYDPVTQKNMLVQRYALATFYFGLGGENWKRKSNMLSSDDECTWHVHSLKCEIGSIVSIQLEDNNLQGSLPSEFGYLKQLQNFSVGNNSISGTIFSEIGLLMENLEVFNLTNNKILGEIPKSFGNLTSLTKLNLSFNNLIGAIPIELGNLVNLISLRLSGNKLTSGVPTELGGLEKSKELVLSNNALSGPIPSEVGRLRQLTLLDLSGNSLTGAIPSEIGNLPKLKELRLGTNRLTESIPNEIFSLEQLTLLDMSANSISGSIPYQLGFLPYLTSLNVSANLIHGNFLSHIYVFQNLSSLDLHSNKFQGRINYKIGFLSQLMILDLGENEFSGTIPSELGELTELTVLNLGSNSLTGTVPTELEYLMKMRNLGLEDNFFTGTIPIGLFPNQTQEIERRNRTQEIERRNSLNKIILKVSNQISDTGLGVQQVSAMNWTFGPNNYRFDPANDRDRISQRYALATLFYSTNGTNWFGSVNFLTVRDECYWYGIECSNDIIDVINLSDNNLIGTVTSEIGYLTNLTTLRLNSNKLSGTIPTQLGSLAQLQQLWLVSNRLCGTIPTQLGSLAQLQHLVLFYNTLSGTIPTQLGSLAQLLVLGLYNNELSGTIPTQLGSLAQLQLLYLGNNKLSGTIPTQLGSLAQLTDLSLSGNILNGTIPSELGQIGSESYNGAPTINLFDMYALSGDLSFLCKNGTIYVWINEMTTNSNISCSCCNERNNYSYY